MLFVEDSPPASARSNRPIPEPPFPRARYRPGIPFPPYRYVPGRHPHPIRDPDGHSYRPPSAVGPAGKPAPPRARTADVLEDWLRGIDLFNAFYFWEAHEAWERAWRAYPRDSAEATLLQGLIQIAAALLKIHLGSRSSARRLATEGLDRLGRVTARQAELFGLPVEETRNSFRTYFAPLDERTLPPIDGSVPPLLLVDVPRP